MAGNGRSARAIRFIERFGDAEVEDFDNAFSGKEQVFGLQVAMNYAQLMGRAHAFARLAHPPYHLRHLALTCALHL